MSCVPEGSSMDIVFSDILNGINWNPPPGTEVSWMKLNWIVLFFFPHVAQTSQPKEEKEREPMLSDQISNGEVP